MIQMAETRRELMSIGEVANAAGVAATALRYYEKEGILTPTVRSGSGYRLYDRQAVEQLEFIRAAQAVGFTLDDVRLLLQIDGGEKRRCKAEVQELLHKRLSQVEQKMKDLRRVRTALSGALEHCQQSAGDNCPLLAKLHVPARHPTNHEVKHGTRTRRKK